MTTTSPVFQKKKYAIAIGAVIVGLLIMTNGSGACRTTSENRQVRGLSLAGVLPEGTQVKLINNYYACHDPSHGEIVAYRAPGRSEPVVKVVYGIPGDQFNVMKTPEGNRILINGQVARNSTGVPYSLSQNRYNFLQLYTRQYPSGIPPESYILLGDIPGGSVDSILFGFIPHEKLIGKIIKQ